MSFSVFGKPHLHGVGTLFVAQDNDAWQLQFTLPAADILGFEHKPTNNAQIQQAISRSDKLRHAEHVFELPSDCRTISTDLVLPFEFEKIVIDDHKQAHGAEHDEHENHHAHKHDNKQGHEAEQEHNDVEATFVLDCTSDIKQLNITLFEHFTAVSKLEVVSVTESGQGSSVVSAQSPKVSLK